MQTIESARRETPAQRDWRVAHAQAAAARAQGQLIAAEALPLGMLRNMHIADAQSYLRAALAACDPTIHIYS